MERINSLISDYLSLCEHEKKLSPDTLKAYRIDLQQYASFVESASGDPASLRSYLKYLNDTYAPRSVKRKLASVRAFYRVMEELEMISQNPFHKFHVRVQYPKQLPRTIPEQIIEAILSSAYQNHHDGSPSALRDLAVLELLFSTGIRVSELCALSPDTVQFYRQKLRLLISGKGNKERVIQIEALEVLNLIRTYYGKYKSQIHRVGAFLLNDRGGRLSQQSVRRIIRRYLLSISSSLSVTPHMFRHTFATSLLEAGMDIRYIQSLLGHSSITTTQIYTYVAAERQAALLFELHPRRRMSFHL